MDTDWLYFVILFSLYFIYFVFTASENILKSTNSISSTTPVIFMIYRLFKLLLLVATITFIVSAGNYQLFNNLQVYEKILSILLIAFSFYFVELLVIPIPDSIKIFTNSLLSSLILIFVNEKKQSSNNNYNGHTKDSDDYTSENETIKNDQKELISGVVEFNTSVVREIMTPRVDITAVDKSVLLKDLMDIINISGHSRIPFYESNIDNIAGIIYAKDLLPYLKPESNKKEFNILDITREPLFVPESKLIKDLLHEFQDKKMHLAIVVDEFGSTAGLITLEDILEEIVGEIRDEYDKDEVEFQKIDNISYLCAGKFNIDSFNEYFDNEYLLTTEGYDTIAGFIISQAGEIPPVDYFLEYNGFQFTVVELINKRISKVKIKDKRK
ncbi:MAG: hemolysin family protein [Melioribacteraceae bacterium]|nr:hemolysin family protein [Melioribacteraceae bacterium]